MRLHGPRVYTGGLFAALTVFLTLVWVGSAETSLRANTANVGPFWQLPLEAGLNLISLPASPAYGDINRLFGETPEIDLIITYEESKPRVALRHPDTGQFVGTLHFHDLRHAYWIMASEAVTVGIRIPPISQLSHVPVLPPKERRPADQQHSPAPQLSHTLATPPKERGPADQQHSPAPQFSHTLATPPKERRPTGVDQSPASLHPSFPFILVRGGEWNLLPVISLSRLEDIPAGTKADADGYLGAFVNAYGWSNNKWVKIDPDSRDDPDSLYDDTPAVEIGKGYWVYYEEDAILIPLPVPKP